MQNPGLLLPVVCLAVSLASLLLTSRGFAARIRQAEDQDLAMVWRIRRDFRIYALKQVPVCAALLAFFLIHNLVLFII